MTKIAVYARDRPGELHHAPLAETRYLAFNTRRPPLNDERVRRALALALDRQKLVERVVLGGQEPAGRFLPPALRPRTETDLPEDSTMRFDPAEARRLLAAAGFADGRGMRQLEITAWSPSQTAVLEAIQAMWKTELGIEVGLAIREGNVHFAALRSGDFDIGFSTAIPDVADAFDVLQNFTSHAPGNYPHWSDARYDALLSQAALTGDPAQRAELFREAEVRLGQLCPVAPLYFNARNWLMSPRVHGWQEDVLWNRFYPSIYLQDN